ncbi:Glycerol-3-phosphate dehydrogenase [NAD(P)+] [wastewater metagenome]|uniref:Glycerol-3-phosphate dehydrogenase [NAD(P)+] n=2 Tax=unclassified sequences TaxID=12908 RepID=A0A5B8RDI4_9ZZZZ|nr:MULTISPECIES: NAD(P)H-dependent glycerol-3-phosphate dehydrogenase [Arhodomonas]QEA06920.1 glycerol-3-phosphate dehydrogenase [NAD(P)+] [uncultured organism]
MTSTPSAIAVLGAGSWGTALALVLARNGHAVTLWGHDDTHVAALERQRSNERYLPGIGFPDGISVTDDLDAAVSGVDWVLVAVPSHAFAATLARLADCLPAGCPVLWATKGLDADSGGLLHHVAARLLPDNPPAALSGPSFAGEVARGLPTAVTVAAADLAVAEHLAGAFHDERFRVYTSTDLVGVGLGGAVKNVLAIATGIADGLGFGANARAGLITRGLAEVRRLGQAMGAADRTFMGLAGVGDLILTCTDDQSRNRRMGLALGRGEDVDAAERAIGQTVEGLRTARELHALARTQGVEMPICEQVHALLDGGVSPEEATRNLMLRTRKAELD